jgi:hypothetical protein
MKRFLILAAIAGCWLSACAVDQRVEAKGTPTNIALVTPNTSMSTPTVGSAIARRPSGMQVLLLRSQPDPKSALTGQVALGERGQVLGLNAAGTWVLLRFNDQSGWAPFAALDLVIAQ